MSSLFQRQLYTFQCILWLEWNREVISNAQILLVIAINLQTSIDHFTYYFHLFAVSLCTPCIQSRITHIAFAHKVVKLVAVVREHMLTANNRRDILVHQLVIMFCSQELLYNAHVLRGDLPRRVQPPRWTRACRYYDPAAFKLAHVLSVHAQFVHACARHVFFRSEYLVQTQLLSDCSHHLIFNLEQGSGAIKVVEFFST